MSRHKAKRQIKDKHHIIPRSRGGASTLDNLVEVVRQDHEYYHALFYNKTPVEVVEYLTHTFFKDKWEYVWEAYQKHERYK
jgi:hypothetical protein